MNKIKLFGMFCLCKLGKHTKLSFLPTFPSTLKLTYTCGRYWVFNSILIYCRIYFNFFFDILCMSKMHHSCSLKLSTARTQTRVNEIKSLKRIEPFPADRFDKFSFFSLRWMSHPVSTRNRLKAQLYENALLTGKEWKVNLPNKNAEVGKKKINSTMSLGNAHRKKKLSFQFIYFLLKDM